MNTWISVNTPPPAPGLYWCASIRREEASRHVVNVYYTDRRFRRWDGTAWIGGADFTHYYSERSR